MINYLKIYFTFSLLFSTCGISLASESVIVETLPPIKAAYICLTHYAKEQAREAIDNRIDSVSNTEKFVIKHSALSYPDDLKVEELYHDEQGFHVLCNNEIQDIEHGFVDSLIRNMDNQQLAYFQEIGQIEICPSTEGLFSLKAYVLLKGGGLFGANAGFWFGKIVTYLIAHGTIAAVSGTVGIFCPSAGWTVASALEKALFIPIEKASNAVGIGLGIAGGTLTGPV